MVLWSKKTTTKKKKKKKKTTEKPEILSKNSDFFFQISSQNMDCRTRLNRWGGSNVYPQSMFLIINKKNNVYPCKPHIYYIKVGFKGSTLYRHVFGMYNAVIWIGAMKPSLWFSFFYAFILSEVRSFYVFFVSKSNRNRFYLTSLQFHHQKTESFQIKILIFFIFPLKT